MQGDPSSVGDDIPSPRQRTVRKQGLAVFKDAKGRQVRIPREELHALQLQTKGKNFSFDGLLVVGKVVDVYDGDTCKCKWKWGEEYVQFGCRLQGIDTPEMKPPLSEPNRLKTKAAAILARDALREMVLDKCVLLELGGWDKYGRVLVYITPQAGGNDRRTVNDRLIADGHANAYDGGKKAAFD